MLKPSSYSPFRVVGLIFVAIGLGFCWNSWSYITSASQAEGIVAEIKRRVVVGGKVDYWPVVEYRVAEKSYRVEASVYESYPTWKVGDPATVVYLPGDPASGRIYSFSELYLFSIGFAGIGVVLLVVGRANPPTSGRLGSKADRPSTIEDELGRPIAPKPRRPRRS